MTKNENFFFFFSDILHLRIVDRDEYQSIFNFELLKRSRTVYDGIDTDDYNTTASIHHRVFNTTEQCECANLADLSAAVKRGTIISVLQMHKDSMSNKIDFYFIVFDQYTFTQIRD